MDQLELAGIARAFNNLQLVEMIEGGEGNEGQLDEVLQDESHDIIATSTYKTVKNKHSNKVLSVQPLTGAKKHITYKPGQLVACGGINHVLVELSVSKNQ